MGIYEAAKDALKVAQKFDNIELVQKIMDIQQQALMMQEKLRDKEKEIDRLAGLAKTLEEKISAKGSYQLQKSVYWRVDDTGFEQPYCPACYSKDVIVPMQKTWARYAYNASPYVCPDKKCGAFVDPWNVTT